MLRQPEGDGEVRFHIAALDWVWHLKKAGVKEKGLIGGIRHAFSAACTHFARRCSCWPKVVAAPGCWAGPKRIRNRISP